MACDCKDVKFGSYDACVPVNPPEHMSGYIARRMEVGLNADGKIWIDKCIVSEIKDLWNIGVHTRGCCCGHNIKPPMVSVADKSIETMIQAGYEIDHPDTNRRDTFRLWRMDHE